MGSVFRFQFPKFDPCILYPFDTLILAHSIVLSLYHFNTLHSLTVTPQKETGRRHKIIKHILQGGRLFTGNYPPQNNPPNIPRHNSHNI